MRILLVKHTDNSPALLFEPSGNFYMLGGSVMMEPLQFYDCMKETISAISSLHEWADIRSAEISSVREIIKKAGII